jgi:hypothetical protein
VEIIKIVFVERLERTRKVTPNFSHDSRFLFEILARVHITAKMSLLGVYHHIIQINGQCEIIEGRSISEYEVHRKKISTL